MNQATQKILSQDAKDGLPRFATVDPEHGQSEFVYLLVASASYVLGLYETIRESQARRAGMKALAE